MPEPQTARPLIIVVDDDPSSRPGIVRALERRYDADYRIVAIEDFSTVTDELTTIRNDGAEVALIIAPQEMKAGRGTSVLGETRDLFPTARRVVITGWGDTRAGPESPRRPSWAISTASLVGRGASATSRSRRRSAGSWLNGPRSTAALSSSSNSSPIGAMARRKCCETPSSVGAYLSASTTPRMMAARG